MKEKNVCIVPWCRKKKLENSLEYCDKHEERKEFLMEDDMLMKKQKEELKEVRSNKRLEAFEKRKSLLARLKEGPLNKRGDLRGMHDGSRGKVLGEAGYYHDVFVTKSVVISAEALVYWNQRVKDANLTRPTGTRAHTLHSILSKALERIARHGKKTNHELEYELAFTEAKPTDQES